MFTREVATLDQGLVDSERTGLRTPSELLPYWRAADYPVAIRQGGTPRMDVAGWEACGWLLCYVMLCYVMLCYVMLCYAMLCYAVLCYAMQV